MQNRGLIKIDILSNRGLGHYGILKKNIIDYNYEDKMYIVIWKRIIIWE